MTSPLLGKVAMVTGSARGLGRAYALRLASLGADIIVSDINLASAKDWNEELTADSVQAEVEAMGRRAISVQADMSNPADVTRLFDETQQAFGRLDILVNNAGGAIARDSGPLATQTSMSDYDLLMDANLRSCLLACQAAAPLMSAQGGGSIINVTSQTAVSTLPGGPLAIYGAAKAGVTVLTRCLAAELGPQGIRVNAIAPGIILTSRVAAQAAERGLGTNTQAQGLPLRRLGQVEDCAGVIEFFARDLSQYVTGQVICADGGAVLNAS